MGRNRSPPEMLIALRARWTISIRGRLGRRRPRNAGSRSSYRDGNRRATLRIYLFTPKGGSVILSCEEHDREVQFAVKDTGPGINPKDLQKMFDPFWQAKPGAHFGSGLGLSIARGIVEQHKGRIWADSTPGAGTTVFFTIPQVDIDQEPLKPKAA